jgi:hypothetical protein
LQLGPILSDELFADGIECNVELCIKHVSIEYRCVSAGIDLELNWSIANHHFDLPTVGLRLPAITDCIKKQ